MLPRGRRLIFTFVVAYIAVCHAKHCTYDPYIECRGPPVGHPDGLPQQFSEIIYSDALTLCSAFQGAPQNVGCYCPAEDTDVVCDESLADPALYHAPLSWREGTLAYFCSTLACNCPKRHHRPSTVVRLASASATRTADPRVTNPYYQYFTGPNAFRSAAWDPLGGFDPLRDFAGSAVGTTQCGIGCSSDEECQSCTTDKSAGDQYSCRAAAKSKVNPAVGAATFLSMCLRNAALSGQMQKNKEYAGKRDVALPCPCNSTYISHGCCGAKDGLVWESAGSNLGRLFNNTDVSC